MKPHLDQALPPTQVAAEGWGLPHQPSGSLGPSNGKQTLRRCLSSGSQLCTPGKGWDPLPEQHYSSSALLNTICFGCYWKKLLNTDNQMELCFLMYKIPESKTDQSFEYHWDANQVTDVRFKRYIPIFLSFKKEILLVTGLAFHALPQAPSVLTDSMNV